MLGTPFMYSFRGGRGRLGAQDEALAGPIAIAHVHQQAP